MAQQRKGRRPAGRSHPKGSLTQRRRGFSLWVVLLFIAVACGAWWYFGMHDSNRAAEEKAKPLPQKPQVTQSTADYRPAIDNLATRLVAKLEAEGAKVEEETPVKKEVKWEETGGRIHWSARNLVVTPSRPLDLPKLIDALPDTAGKVTLSEAHEDTWHEDAVERYEVTLNDRPKQDEITMIIAHLYVYPVKATQAAGTETPQATAPPETPKATPAAGKTAKLAILIDDAGTDLESQAVYASIGRPFSLAVMPNMAHTGAAAAQAAEQGFEIMLHLPMEPVSGSGMEAGTLLTTMSVTDISGRTKAALAQVPGAVGVNNHQGSKFTADRGAMLPVLQILRDRGLFYVDSATSADSIGSSLAGEMGIATRRNELFIDNDSSVAAICERLRQAAAMAQRDGSALVIGHCRPNTAEAVRQMVPELEAQGIELVYVSQLVG